LAIALHRLKRLLLVFCLLPPCVALGNRYC